MRIEVESRIIKWGKDYILVPSNGKLLESRSVRKYVVCKDSTLWHVAKNSDGPEDVFMFLQKEVE